MPTRRRSRTPAAEERFKAVAEAYAVLSYPKKRGDNIELSLVILLAKVVSGGEERLRALVHGGRIR